MKKLIILTFLIVGFFAKAQQQELFDNDWFLTQIVIDGEIFPTPPSDTHAVFGDEVSIEYLTEVYEGGVISTSGCNGIGIDMNELDDNSFTVLSVGSTMMDCMYPLYDAHDVRYIWFFGGRPDSEIPWAGFQYEIIHNSDNTKTLVITNPDGDKAYYNNSLLSTSEISDPNVNFQIAFQNENLIIKGFKSIAKSVSIYDLSGELILESEIKNEKINTNNLSKGIYIVKIKDKKGKFFSKKVRKE